MIPVNENEKKATDAYKKSVEALLRVARFNSGGSRAAAQVLLSAYNGDCFHVDVTALGTLDRENFGHALRVISGRNQNPWLEPHQVVENGTEIFGRLWDEWPRLHVQNRWKKSCPDCGGSGWRYVDIEREDLCRKESCRHCEGRGLMANVKWPGYE